MYFGLTIEIVIEFNKTNLPDNLEICRILPLVHSRTNLLHAFVHTVKSDKVCLMPL